MDIYVSMDIHGKSVDIDMDMDGKFHIHDKPGCSAYRFQIIEFRDNLSGKMRLNDDLTCTAVSAECHKQRKHGQKYVRALFIINICQFF